MDVLCTWQINLHNGIEMIEYSAKKSSFRVRQGLNIVLFLAVLFFIGKFLYLNLKELDLKSLNIRPGLFFVSIFAVWFWLIISALVFHLIMSKIVTDLRFKDNIKIWSTSYLGTYIPGKIGVITYRILQFKKYSISASRVSYGFFIEMVLSVLSSGIVVIISSFFLAFSFLKDYFLILIIVLVLLLLIIHPRLVSLYAKVYFRYIRKSDDFHISPFNYMFYLKILSLQLLKWCFSGIGIYLLINSFIELSIDYFPFVTGLYAAASIIGLLAFFAPSGLGVVEGVLIVGFGSIMSGASAGIASLLIRLWKVIGELSFILLLRIVLLRIFKSKEF